ncbi:MAG: aminotransferase class III-fold pyridoxal phosphate-dependent enzyme [Pseudomonadales bacterium]|nr:aminotransferase class III-fold pyridoxal phosphate-dependent enzyme [Pseudomonadales bacterium]
MKAHNPSRSTLLRIEIHKIIEDLSGLEEDEINDSSSFLELGFDSLFMTQLASAFQKAFAIEITFKQLMRELNSADKLAVYLDSNLPEDKFQPTVAPPEPAKAANVNSDVEPLVQNQPSTQSLMENVNTSIHNELAPNHDSQGLMGVFQAQLRLMSEQLDILQNGKATQIKSLPKTSSSTQPVEQQSNVNDVANVSNVENNVEDHQEDAAQEIKLPPGFGPQLNDDINESSLGKAQDYLNQLIETYSQKTYSSKQLTQQYRRNHADPRTAAGFNQLWKEIVYPIVINRSKGSRLWDLDNNEYIDLLNGFGPNFLGHAPDFIQEALASQVSKGFELGPQTPLAGEAAKLICELTGSERATFVNTGSEAVQAVIRVARTVTNKDKIVVFNKDYHGNFDEVLVRGANTSSKLRTLPLAPGIPRSSVENMIVLEYGEERSLEIIKENADEIAAVIIEPVQSRRPEFRPKSFIKKLRQLTETQNILFVFDEVITGFRTGLGGAQSYYEVKADLATYGKVIGGGMPIGVVAGKSKYMDTFDGGYWQYGDDSFPEAGVTFFAGTFLRHPMTIASAHATLNYLKQQGDELYHDVYAKTSRLAVSLNQLFRNNDIDIHVAHFSSQMYFRISDENNLVDLLFYQARLNGIYMLEGFPSYLTLSHTEEDINNVIGKFTEAVRSLQQGDVFNLPSSRTSDSYPLTTSQTDILVASQLSDTATCAYNESDTVRLEGSLDIASLQVALDLVLNRHPALNTRISIMNQQQLTDWNMTHTLNILDYSSYTDEATADKLDAFYEDQATTPFDLETGPLVRFHLLKLAEDRHLLVIYGHHIVFDGWSSSIILHEIGQLYSALVLQKDVKLPKVLGFNEYYLETLADNKEQQINSCLAFWHEHFPTAAPLHNLPSDFPRSAERTFEGATLHYEFSQELLESIHTASAKAGVTNHNFLLAGFLLLLHLKSKDQQLLVGIPTAGQALASNDCLVGYCVNLLPLLIDVDSDRSLEELLQQVRDSMLDILDNQEVHFSQLLKELPIQREPGRCPLIELVFNYSSFFESLEFGDLKTSVYENPRSAVVFDMFFNIVEMENTLHVDWDFSSELYSFDTIYDWVEELGIIYQTMTDMVSQEASLQTLMLNLHERKT